MKKTNGRPRSARPRKRLVVEIDPVLVDLLRLDRVKTERPVSHLIEDILAVHYGRKAPRIGA